MVAVFPLENRGTSLNRQELEALGEFLAVKLGESGRYQIIPNEQIKSRLNAQRAESYKECYEQSCQIELGRELAAQYTVSASLSRVGNQCLITAAMYDLRKAATEGTATARGECHADALVTALEGVAIKLSSSGSSPAPPADMASHPESRPAPWPPAQLAPTPAAQPVIYMPPRREKNAVIALLWGLLFPGGGLYYSEHYV